MYFFAMIGADTAESEQNVAEFFTKIRLHGSASGYTDRTDLPARVCREELAG